MKSSAVLICMTLILPLLSSVLPLSVPIIQENWEPEPMERYEYTIRIDGDDDFSPFPGEGTHHSPYIIEGMDIDSQGRGAALYVGNTTSHFVIRNSRMSRASEYPVDYHWNSCIVLYNVTNGSVFNNTIERGSTGIYLKGVNNISLDNNRIFQSTSSGIYAYSSGNVGISHNEILSPTGTGIQMISTSKSSIEYNSITGSRREGIHLLMAHGILIHDNNIWNSGLDGVFLQHSRAVTLHNNDFRGAGIRFQGNELEHWSSHRVPENNTRDGSPIIYMTAPGAQIPSNPGQIIMVNVTGALVEYMAFSGGSTAIALAFSRDIKVRNVNISSHTLTGIHLYQTDGCELSGVDVQNSGTGILMEGAVNCRLENVTLSNNPSGGLEVLGSSQVILLDSNIDENGMLGVRLHGSTDITLHSNNYTNQNRGISIEWSQGASVSRSFFTGCNEGIFLSYSTDVNIENNTFDGFGLRVAGNLVTHWSTHEIVFNSVRGKPLAYIRDSSGGVFDTTAGQIIVANSSDMTITRQEVAGITVGFSSNMVVRDAQVNNNTRDGIHLYRSHNNTFEEVTLGGNHHGLYCFLSDNNHFTNLSVHNNFYGLYIHGSTGVSLIGSRFDKNTGGVFFSTSSDMTLHNNIFQDNGDSVTVFRSDSVSMEDNYMVGGGIFMDGQEDHHWDSHLIGESNILNGGPVKYLANAQDVNISEPFSQIILGSCSNISVENQFMERGSTGITVAFSNNIQIENVSVQEQNRNGFYLYRTENTWITGCDLADHSQSAVQLRHSHGNHIAFNHIRNCTQGIHLWDSNDNRISQNHLSGGSNGIQLRDSHHNIITNNSMGDQRNGLDLSGSSHNVIAENHASGNHHYGIRLFRSDDNQVIKCSGMENGISGLSVSRSSNNIIHNSTFDHNAQHGVYLQYAHGNELRYVSASHNQISGIRLSYSVNNSAQNNYAESNRWYGVYLSHSFFNRIHGNFIHHNHHGIYLLSSDDNHVSDNQVNSVDQEDFSAVLVGLEPALLGDENSLAEIGKAVNGRVTTKFRYVDVVRILLDGRTPGVDAVELLQKKPGVRFVEPDMEVELLNIPDDPHFPQLWGLEKTYLPGAWNHTTGSGDAVVAVIDTGVDYLHEDLKDNMWSDEDGNHGYNALDGSNDPMDDHGHGTHAAGTVGAVGNNSVGVTGVNWNVSLMALKFISSGGTGNISSAIACLEYVLDMKRNGVEIIATSNSWGSEAFSRALYEAVEIHRDEDILFIAAAGNSGRDSDVAPMYPAAFNLTNVISVAASDPNDLLAGFSNYGPNSVHLAAPGTGIYSTERNDNYGHRSGTSMATPHVAGLAALLWSQNRSMDMLRLRNSILSHTDSNPELQGRIMSGGRMNALLPMDPDENGFHVRVRVSGGFIGSVGVEKDIFVAVTDGVNPITDADVTLTVDGEDIILKDDGVGTDQISGDGYYSGSWKPTRSGNVTLNITVDAGDNRTYTYGCTVFIRSNTGIYMDRSFNNVLRNNSVTLTQEGIILRNSCGNLLEKHTVLDVTEGGISLRSSDLNRLLGNILSLNNVGISMESSSLNQILQNEMVSNSLAGIDVSDKSLGNLLEYNKVHHSHRGINLHSQSGNNLLLGNEMYHCVRGITLQDTYENTLLENIALYGDIGLYVNKGTGNLIKNNDFSSNDLHYGSSGIYLLLSDNNTIDNNAAVHNSHQSIYLGYSNHNVISRNLCSQSELYSIYMSGSHYNELRNNVLENSYRGLNLHRSSHNLIGENTMENHRGSNSGYGIFLSTESDHNHIFENMVRENDNGIGVSGDHNLVEGNSVTLNTRYGIYVYARYNMITSNNISLNEKGIYLWLGSSENAVVNNLIYENLHGVELNRNCDGNFIAENVFHNNVLSLSVRDSKENTIINNHISDSVTGVELKDASGNGFLLNHLSENSVGLLVTDDSRENRILGNEITNGGSGLLLEHSFSNLYYGNRVEDNLFGVNISHSQNDRFHHNNIVNNQRQVSILYAPESHWDDGMGQGNHWSDYSGEDNTGDGVGNTLAPHPWEDMGDGYHGLDSYPLVDPVQVVLHELEVIPENGWQFISVPMVPFHTGGILGDSDYIHLFSYRSGRWTSYVPGRSTHFNDRITLDNKGSFLIRMDEPATFLLVGHVPSTGKTSITLEPGWNMVGHPSIRSQNASDVLPPEVTMVGIFNPDHPNNIQYLDDHSSLVLEPGRGYWLYNSATYDVTYAVDW